MDQAFTHKKQGKLRILVAPLDWGLGHATRCIPLVRELLAHGCEPFLAGEGAQEQLLKEEFPDLPFIPLAGYRIRYARTARGMVWKMLQQGPKLTKAIKAEQEWLKQMTKQHHFDAVISDNRYGLYHEKIPCVFITHQLNIKSSAGKWTERILNKRNYRYINRFTECWVPDIENGNNLAGELSHPAITPAIPVRYIGWLTRFENDTRSQEENKGHLLFILSGPEPQRSLLEETIITQVSNYNGHAVIVRGLPGNESLIPSTNMIRVYNHLPADALQKEIERAEFIISRSGYSTVMDLVALNKKSILIPTPGQTEQEYLGKYLQQKGFAIAIKQDEFSLSKALEIARSYSYQSTRRGNNDRLKKAVAQLAQSLAALG